MEYITRLATINRDTGELLDIDIAVRKRSSGGKYMKVFLKALDSIDTKGLRGNSYRVLIKLVTHANSIGLVPSGKSVSILTGLKKCSVSMAFKELKDNGVIVKKENNYYLNPYIFWTGDDKSQLTACRELFSSIPKQLVEGTAEVV